MDGAHDTTIPVMTSFFLERRRRRPLGAVGEGSVRRQRPWRSAGDPDRRLHNREGERSGQQDGSSRREWVGQEAECYEIIVRRTRRVVDATRFG